MTTRAQRLKQGCSRSGNSKFCRPYYYFLFHFFKYRVIVTSQTWDRECHGLFDFDIQNLEKVENKYVGCGFIQRHQQQISVQHPGLAIE